MVNNIVMMLLAQLSAKYLPPERGWSQAVSCDNQLKKMMYLVIEF